MRMKALLVSLVTLQVLDGLLTYYGVVWLRLPEANPLLVFLFGVIGVIPALLLAKGITIVVSVWIFRSLSRLPFGAVRHCWTVVSWGLVAIYSFVVGHWIWSIFFLH